MKMLKKVALGLGLGLAAVAAMGLAQGGVKVEGEVNAKVKIGGREPVKRSPIRVTVNGDEVAFDQPPVMRNARRFMEFLRRMWGARRRRPAGVQDAGAHASRIRDCLRGTPRCSGRSSCTRRRRRRRARPCRRSAARAARGRP